MRDVKMTADVVRLIHGKGTLKLLILGKRGEQIEVRVGASQAALLAEEATAFIARKIRRRAGWK